MAAALAPSAPSSASRTACLHVTTLSGRVHDLMSGLNEADGHDLVFGEGGRVVAGGGASPPSSWFELERVKNVVGWWTTVPFSS